ncbi:hypothetical protein [Burkholderia sp.]|uniref:hypothetical protein n=1 Tax=Burkholderia sp. TaxID=36773 RepID=UPI0025C350E7|nr:hypothetical protein [Burkholderia sp.]MBS6359396.1 hypothetical protein [Burkholderia sp.]
MASLFIRVHVDEQRLDSVDGGGRGGHAIPPVDAHGRNNGPVSSNTLSDYFHTSQI